MGTWPDATPPPWIRHCSCAHIFLYSARGAKCCVPHECKGFGLEDLGLGTGEAAFCQGKGSEALCPGVYLNGSTIVPPNLTACGSGIRAGSNGTCTSTSTSTITTTITGPTTTVTTNVTVTDSDPTATVTITEPTTTTITATFDPTPTLTVAPVSVTITASFEDPDSSFAVVETVTLTQYPATTTPIPPTTTPSPCQSASCAGKTEGIYYHQNCDCRQYYTCIKSVVDGDVLILREYRCSGRRYFDPKTSQCTSDLTVCPYA